MRRIDMRRQPAVERSTFPSMSLQDYFTYMGRQYAMGGSYGTTPAASFVGYVRDVGERNGVVAAAVAARALLISQVRFTWRNNRASATPGRTFGDRNLSILERPGQMTRSEMLNLAEQDVSYSGSWIAHRQGNELFRLRPDWVTVVMGSNSDPVDDWVPPDARITGFAYGDPSKPNGRKELFLPDEVIHWKPEPHPLEWWRGQSWVTSVVQEIRNDGQATNHTSKFFDHAATPNMVFTMDPNLTVEQVQAFADLTNQRHAGSENAYKNLFLGGGTGVEVVGSENAALGLKDIQGGYEARIASRARVPAVVLGIREGMGGSALNSGNYAQTRRLWADGWFTPSVQGLCASAERVMKPAADAELWYDPSEVLFLQEDQKDAAEIQGTKAQTIRTLTDGGYTPESIKAYMKTDDEDVLEHTNLFSVQLQPPGAQQQARARIERGDGGVVNVYPVAEVHNHLPKVERAEVPVVNVAAPTVNVAAPNVNVENMVPVPSVTVEASPVPVTVEPAPVFIADPPRTRRVVRDGKGNITKVVEE